MNTSQNNLEPLDSKYIELIEQSNKELAKSVTLFNFRNIFIYSGLFVALYFSALFLIPLFESKDVFKNHLTEVPYSKDKILIQSENGKYYEINKTSKLRWLTKHGVLVAIDESELMFSNTKDYQNNEGGYFSLIIPRKQLFNLVLTDGTKIQLNEKTNIRFTNNNVEPQTNVFLNGEAFFKVAHQTRFPFTIKTNEANIKVLGTEFNVNSYKGNAKTQIALVKGSVNISNGYGNKTLLSGDMATVKSNKSPITIGEANFAEVLFWQNDQYYFSNESLELITSLASRWFDVKFRIPNDRIRDLHFTGRINKEESIVKFMEFLQYAEGISYSINDKEIVLSRK